jgi:hypothetical protein
MPKLTNLAVFEMGIECGINASSPEDAVKFLR